MKEKRLHMRRFLFFIYLVLTCAYLVWRIGFTLNWDYPIYSFVFLTAEVYCILASFVFYTLILSPRQRDAVEAPAGLSVDVFIATYNEDEDLLRQTAVAARDMDYAHHTWICDDGRRATVEALAKELGVGYITRLTNDHFKAGNLNNALKKTSGDFVLVLDADHVPQRHFLTRVLGLFQDEKLALVQTPQVYYNVDSFQHHLSTRRRRFWHEAGVFHHLMQPGADRLNAAFFVGTGAVVRRSALDAIGGFAVGSITEDIHTSMRLHAHGFKSAYVDEALGYMLAADTPLAYTRQRLRWAQGAMQILRNENPLTKKGLTLCQRIGYLNSLAGYLGAYQHLLFYIAPALYLFTGIAPIAIDPYVGFPLFVAHIILDLAMYKILAAPFARLFLGECFKIINLTVFIRASAELLGNRKLFFQVTPKGRHAGLPYGLLLPSAAIFLVSLTAVAMGVLRLTQGDSFPAAVLLTTFFSAQFSVASALALLHSYQREGVEEGFVFPASVPSKLYPLFTDPVPVTIRRLNTEKAYIISPRNFRIGDRMPINLSPVGIDRSVDVDIIDSHPCEDKMNRGRFILEARFQYLMPTEKDVINAYLFETAVPQFMAAFEDGPPLGRKRTAMDDPEPIEHFFHLRSGIM